MGKTDREAILRLKITSEDDVEETKLTYNLSSCEDL